MAVIVFKIGVLEYCMESNPCLQYEQLNKCNTICQLIKLGALPNKPHNYNVVCYLGMLSPTQTIPFLISMQNELPRVLRRIKGKQLQGR